MFRALGYWDFKDNKKQPIYQHIWCFSVCLASQVQKWRKCWLTQGESIVGLTLWEDGIERGLRDDRRAIETMSHEMRLSQEGNEERNWMAIKWERIEGSMHCKCWWGWIKAQTDAENRKESKKMMQRDVILFVQNSSEGLNKGLSWNGEEPGRGQDIQRSGYWIGQYAIHALRPLKFFTRLE